MSLPVTVLPPRLLTSQHQDGRRGTYSHCAVPCPGTVTTPRPGWADVLQHRGLLGVPAGLPTRNAGLRQTLPSQRHFLTCWGLEKKTQASDLVQEVQPSLSSGRCSAPPPWTRPSTSCGSHISVQPVSLWPLAWRHTPWRGLERAAALVPCVRRPQMGNEQDPVRIREWPGPLVFPCRVARPSRLTLGPGCWEGAARGGETGAASCVPGRLWDPGGGTKLPSSQRRLPTTKLKSEASDRPKSRNVGERAPGARCEASDRAHSASHGPTWLQPARPTGGPEPHPGSLHSEPEPLGSIQPYHVPTTEPRCPRPVTGTEGRPTRL